MDHGQWAKEKSIMCFECNSEYDPRCGDPFDSYTIGIVNCSKKRPLNHITEKPTLCRKTVQKDTVDTVIKICNLKLIQVFFSVQGNLRVIRGCGYIPDKNDDKQCLLRTGTHDVHVRYCSCKGNLCNTGSFQYYPSRIASGAILLTITRVVQI
ncbi:uncharacterized protein BDFB_009917 [Asbolus verrucosus]|uniref:Uncharacterized protein n=1 Tax=Asbolus verrucosus TaxID=1661398 RepID=A0A482VMV4_ASBVE|nr:uncharacterized protein BDFB_009917 [Asbolus verrucosus]